MKPKIIYAVRVAIVLNDEKFIERAEIIREKGTNRSKLSRGEVDKYTWLGLGSS